MGVVLPVFFHWNENATRMGVVPAESTLSHSRARHRGRRQTARMPDPRLSQGLVVHTEGRAGSTQTVLSRLGDCQSGDWGLISPFLFTLTGTMLLRAPPSPITLHPAHLVSLLQACDQSSCSLNMW